MLQSAPKTAPKQAILAIGIGCAMTLAVYGYQFGRSNHSVYLLDALRQNDPTLLANDWYTTGTFQYHVIFTHFSAVLMRLEIVEPVFALLYGALVLLFHLAWWRIVVLLGGDESHYLLAAVLYYLCAAGTGLGMYQFFQDSSLLPSNLANVAMLWGICLWIAGRPIGAGVCVGIAGLFHLNHALIGITMWGVLGLLEWGKANRRNLLIGGLLAIVPGALNVALAARLKLSRSGAMPLEQFVEIYVRLRHPHHYDPSSWPLGIWLAMLLPTIAGLVLLRGRAMGVFRFMLGLNLLALIGAGFWYFSETLVQMSLYRFSIYVQLLGCSAAGIWIGSRVARRGVIGAAAYGSAGLILAIGLVRGPFFGVFRMAQDDPAYRQLCGWVAQNLPEDAVVLVPPDEESMRLIGRRAIVVNFKCVPQLSAELAQWKQRLCDVLAVDDLSLLPRGYEPTLRALRARYHELSAAQLQIAAAKYRARYIVTTQLLDLPAAHRIFSDPSQRYFVYECAPLTEFVQ